MTRNKILKKTSVKMRLFVTILFAIASVTTAQQQQLDPAYLRQYYAQLAAQGQQGQRAATPIFEPQEQSAPQQFAPQPARNVRIQSSLNS